MTCRPTTSLRCERLEDRTTPTTITVTTAADVVDPNDGLTSLREAVAAANESADGPFIPTVIEFAPGLRGDTIPVGQVGGTTDGPAAFEIRRPIEIRGAGQKIVRRADAPDMRLFTLVDNPQSIPLPGGGTAGVNSSLQIRDVELLRWASAGVGGAVYAAPNTALWLRGVTLADNTAFGEGGAVYAHNATVDVRNCTITNNRVLSADGPARGAAIRFVGDGPDAACQFLRISYSTLYDNPGGPAVDATLSLGARFLGAVPSVSVYGSIIYTPDRPTGVDDLVVEADGPWGWYFGSMNLIGAVGDPTRWGVVSSADPRLDEHLEDNGGPTRTLAPLAGSPVIDAGHAPLDPSVGWCGVGLEWRVSDDQRGAKRTAGHFDLGSVEVGADVPLAAPTPPHSTDPLPAANLSHDVLRPAPSGDRGPPPPFQTATGAAPGQLPEVRVYDANNMEVKRFLAYSEGFLGGVNVAVGDINRDSIPDIITAAGAGGGPHVKVFDGRTFGEIASFYAYAPGFAGGVSVAVGDVTGDGRADIVTGAGPGGGPHVKVFDGQTMAEVRSFYAYAESFRGGVSVAVGNGLKGVRQQIVTGAGAGGGPHVRVFDPDTLAEVRSFYAYDPGFAGGVNVAADGLGRIVTGAGPGGGPHLKVFLYNIRDPYGSWLKEDASLFTAAEADSGGVQVSFGSNGRVRAVTRRADGAIVVEQYTYRLVQENGDWRMTWVPGDQGLGGPSTVN